MNRRTLIGLIFIVGALLKLADMWGIIHLEWLWQRPRMEYFGVFLILYIGVELVISGFRNNRSQWLQHPVPVGDNGKRICCAVHYGADEYTYHGEPFHGAKLDAFCGGLRLDLRDAVISEDEEIDIHTYLGWVELLVPSEVNVVVKSRSFIGGTDNETVKSLNENAHCLHIISSNMFGGVNIRN